MKKTEKKSKSANMDVGGTPFGLSPGILLCYYLLVCTLTGNVVASVEPLKDMMRTRGIFANLPNTEELLSRSTNYGSSGAILTALGAGVLNDYYGPLSAAVLGQICSIVGFALMFLSPPDSYFLIVAGNTILGITYSCVSISHTSIAALFPGRAALAITTMCVGNDLSLAVPNVLRIIANRFGSIRVAVVGYCALCGVILLLETVLVPRRPFTPQQEVGADDESQIAKNDQSSYNSIELSGGASGLSMDMTTWPVKRQMQHHVYWIITLFICLSFFRKAQYAQLVRSINATIADYSGSSVADGVRVTDAFKFFLPFGFLGSIVSGALTNRFGVVVGLFVLNSWATILFLLSSLPVLMFQWLSIIFFNLYSGFIFGMMYASLGAFFGFSSMGTLQGAIKVFTGISGLLFTPWNSYVIPRLPDVLWANRIIFFGSVAAYLMPLSIIFWPPDQDVASKWLEITDSSTRRPTSRPHFILGRHTLLPMMEMELDKSSLFAIATDTKWSMR